jgi:cytoskeletal protein RodZ
MKGLYLLVLIAFVAGIFKQGEEGGELVYEYGINVEKVKELDDKIFDLEEALEEAEEKADAVKEESASEEIETVPASSEPAATPVETTPVEMPSTSEPETVPAETTASEIAPVVKETATETLRTEVEEEVVGEKYEEMVQPQIATH